MPVVQMTSSFCQAAVCNPGRAKTDYYDVAVSGFILTVSASGSKVFSLRYRDRYGKQRQHKIGNAKVVTFEKARQAAKQLASKVSLGDSPVDEKQALKKVPTLAEFIADTYLPHIHQTRRNFQSTISFLNHHILPSFGSKHLDEITSDMIEEAHLNLKAKGYALAMANKLPVLFKIMFNLAKKKGVHGASTNPALGVQLFVTNNAKERYLTQSETERLLMAMEQSDNKQLKYIVPLMLMFGCRKRELLDAQWNDFDLVRRNWHIPMSKNGKPRNIPISLKALELLEKLPRWPGCTYVVPNPSTKKPFANLFHSWNKARQRAGLGNVRVHDLRHTFASNLVNSGQSIYVVSKLLGHSQIKTTTRYSHLSDATLLSAVDSAANAVDFNSQGSQQGAGH
ncbi:site-specific integrase [Limnohabitans sp. 2KL-3]|uniref:tyrosine-type recombinase/integrase n=1 Tax=Limnohabitans sp. 2KL-3 TaxID=1100700 RepID=UPI000A662988|nr:site-specific integrase [Limnohabitans sp. 2KL-3]